MPPSLMFTPMLKPDSSRSGWVCASQPRMSRIASEMPEGSLSQVDAAQADFSGSKNWPRLMKMKIQRKKYSTLPPVRRSQGSRSNSTAKNAATASAGTANTSDGSSNCQRSIVVASPCHCWATRPMPRPTATSSANTSMWLVHFASR